jgi:hypothetical protein
MAFWRRAKGRHALGAAVTSIPAAPVSGEPGGAPISADPASATRPVAPATAPPPMPTRSSSLDWSFPELTPPAPAAAGAPPTPPGPRVELTFRDGTSTALDPTQAQALDEIAQILTRRD